MLADIAISHFLKLLLIIILSLLKVKYIAIYNTKKEGV